MLISALVGLGLVSVGRLGVNLYPDVEFPYVMVRTILPGASPETMETEVTDILEEELSTISGLKSLDSTSAEGISMIGIEFALSESSDEKIQDVRDKVGRARQRLPREIEAPLISKFDSDSSPILSIMISGDMSVRELTYFARTNIKERVQRVPGVGSVSLVGGREREIRIWLDATRLRAYHLTADDVINAIRREHAEIPGGRLDTAGRKAELGIKTLGEVQKASEFEDIVISFGNGRPTQIRDVARVEDGFEDERSYAELDGRPGISLEVRRQSGQNTVEVARAIKAEVEKLQSEVPEGVELVVARDVSLFIEASTRDVREDIIVGILLVILVTFAFLTNIRATIIVAVAMPTALVSTFFALYIFDFSINTLTLVALSLSVGLLVDDAIVVLECVHRKIAEGMPRMQAASEGVREVGGAIIAGTLSVCAVFVPIAFMQGVVGKFFFEYGLTITFSVAVSLLVSITLTPALCSRFLKQEETKGVVARWFERQFDNLAAWYKRLLIASIRRTYTPFTFSFGGKGRRIRFTNRVMVFSVTMLLISVGIFFASTLPFAFDVAADRGEFQAHVSLPYGVGIEKSKAVGSRVAGKMAEVENVERVFMTVGANTAGSVNQISFYIGLTPKDEREIGAPKIMAEVRKVMTRAAPEAKSVTVSDIPSIGGGGMSNEIMLSLEGQDLGELRALSSKILTAMRQSGLFIDILSSWEEGRPEVQYEVNRARAADLGVSVRTIATTIRTLVGGLDVTTFEEDGERYDVRLQLEERHRSDLAHLNLIQVRSVNGNTVDLLNVASYAVRSSASQIDRRDRARSIMITSNLPPGIVLGEATTRLEAMFDEMDIPSDIVVKFVGKAEMMNETKTAIMFALMMALVALYMILASQFNSFVQPGIIMLTAPLSFMGAFIALAMTGGIFTLFTQIALVALMGLVMKNGILLVDYANQLREENPDLDPVSAMIEAAPVRLRPVLMTAISTISGMIPVALATSQGSEFRNAMGTVVIGGLASSTFLTLIVVPAAYCSVAIAGERMGKRFGGRKSEAALPEQLPG